MRLKANENILKRIDEIRARVTEKAEWKAVAGCACSLTLHHRICNRGSEQNAGQSTEVGQAVIGFDCRSGPVATPTLSVGNFRDVHISKA